MPKKPMTAQEVAEMRARILTQALSLLAEKGFEGFSMREVARRMGVVIGTLYGYYGSKDEVYLAVLTWGFERLHDRCRAAGAPHAEPLERLKAMGREYMDFGMTEPNFYNLMFTWHVPKFADYVGTDREPAARHELETALRVYELFLATARAYASGLQVEDEEAVRFYVIYLWCTLHGYIAGINNTLLNYMHDSPATLSGDFLETLFNQAGFFAAQARGFGPGRPRAAVANLREGRRK
ncbi:MAG: TetR/AcrR family transcriptional regulator [Thermodesulfobacteriota bacterium]